MKPIRVFDIEIYRDYLLIMFRDIATGKTAGFEMFDGQPLDKDGVRKILKSSTLVSFNGNNFDVPIMSLALSGADNLRLKQACDAIIVGNLRSWQLENKFRFKCIQTLDHIDLIEVAPGMVSLKIYGGRLHCQKMQDLPIEPSASISPAEREALKIYCGNDLQTTEDLYRKLLPQLELRAKMSEEYGQDLRSKSDAQIAEAVIKAQVEGITGEKPERPEIPAGTVYRYTAPDFITFEREDLRKVLSDVEAADFVVHDSGKLNEPAFMKNLRVNIGSSSYRMGIGGLHSTESGVCHVADDDTVLLDRDVASYYPAIVLNCGLAPSHMGNAFSTVYRTIVDKRLAAKHSGDKVVADALKITINGTFGKLGSKWSILYSPDLMLQTTVTGQLSLLMLIEQVEAAGIPVVSANTDGVVIKCPKVQLDLLEDIVKAWEFVTGFDTEETRYSALYSRDVNNYLALKEGGGHKAKGVFASAGIAKNPANGICVDAVLAYLKAGTPIADTVNACIDVTKFVAVRSVKGGAVDQYGDYLGKAVRWYKSAMMEGPLRYKVNGYVVPRTEGCQALMELPFEMPVDIDRQWYITEANEILAEIGVVTP
jgi:DNA polymerase elongation subunit (family B)